jgi:hypothetical protein
VIFSGFLLVKIYYYDMNWTKMWKIWARTIDHRIGETDHDRPDVPVLTLQEARLSCILRTVLVLVNIVTCGFIIANAIHHW